MTAETLGDLQREAERAGRAIEAASTALEMFRRSMQEASASGRCRTQWELETELRDIKQEKKPLKKPRRRQFVDTQKLQEWVNSFPEDSDAREAAERVLASVELENAALIPSSEHNNWQM